MESAPLCKYFFVERCPAAGCSEASWKKAQVWGWTAKNCLTALRHHLQKSAYHDSLRPEKVQEYVDTVVLREYLYKPGEDEADYPGPKRRRLDEDDGSEPQAAEAGATSSTAPFSAVPPPKSQQQQLPLTPPDADQIAFGASQVLEQKVWDVVHWVTKAQEGCRACARLASAAATAFADEYEELENAKKALFALLHQPDHS